MAIFAALPQLQQNSSDRRTDKRDVIYLLFKHDPQIDCGTPRRFVHFHILGYLIDLEIADVLGLIYLF